MNKKTLILPVLLLVAFSFVFTSCQDNENADESGTGSLNLKITDAPIDDNNIKGAYVTIAKVKVDGQIMEGFTKQTVDLLAYQNGETKLLFNEDEINAGSYNSIELVLDYESDQWGNNPGCFVVTDDVVKHDLSDGATIADSLSLDQSFDIESNGTTDIIVDFDLRKAIQYDNPSVSESNFSFVASSELDAAVRSVMKTNSGSIEGSITESASAGDKIVVYAYQKGQFNAETEQEGTIKFKNAVSSASASESGDYLLPYLPEGEYELHFASYDMDSEGKFAFTGLIKANSLSDNIMLSDISVSSNTKINLNINVVGLL